MPRTKLARSFWFSCFHAEAINCHHQNPSHLRRHEEGQQKSSATKHPLLIPQEDPTFHEMSSSSEGDDNEIWDLHILKSDEENTASNTTTTEIKDAITVVSTDDSSVDENVGRPVSLRSLVVVADDDDHVKTDIPQDVFHEICQYLFDPITLCHVSCVSKDLHQRLLHDLESSSLFWKPLYEHRWIRSSCDSSMTVAFHDQVGSTDWNQLFQERYALEGHVIRTIQRVVEEELEPDGYDFQALQQRSNGRIASTYIENADWKRLIHRSDEDDANTTTNNNNTNTSNILDVLCAIANMEVEYHPMLQTLQREEPARRWPLFRFVAASAAFTFHCQEVVAHMNQLCERSVQQQVWNPSFLTTASSQLVNEEAAMGLAHALRTIPDVLCRSSSLQQCQQSVSQRLDEIATTVRQYLECCLGEDCVEAPPRNDTRALLQTIHFVLSTQYGIRYHYPIRRRTSSSTTNTSTDGDDIGCDDIAVHSCSIAHVLLCPNRCQEPSLTNQDNWCHPVLVAIIYQAVARRLGLVGDILFCPQNCHSLLRFTSATETTTHHGNQRSSSSSPCLLFLDLVEDPGRIMTLSQCKELVRRCDLMTEQTFQDRRRHLNIPWPNHIHHDDDDEEDWREDADAFCFQPSMTVQNVVFWLISPFLVSRQDDGMMESGGDEWPESEEDQPYDFLLGQLIEGNGGSLLSFLQDRLVFFSAIMRHCKLIH